VATACDSRAIHASKRAHPESCYGAAVRRPTRESIEGLRPISRDLTIDLVAAIGYGISGALVSSLLPTIARRGGLEPLALRPSRRRRS
jgi:hypothetical protein